jgi:ribonucleotide reductase beta subunit family protein with ferritin-like domain
VEGIFFSGAFCSIFWMKERTAPGLCFRTSSSAVTKRCTPIRNSTSPSSSAGEQDHRRAGDRDGRQTVSIETNFITEALPCAMLGMNATAMTTYIQFVADRLLLQMGFSKLYNAQNPFDFMSVYLPNKTNFLKGRVSEYARAGVNVDVVNDDEDDDDFR